MYQAQFAAAPKIIVQCDCGQKFSFDLAAAAIKICPNCQSRFTHAFVFTLETDKEALDEFVDDILSEIDPEIAAEIEAENKAAEQTDAAQPATGESGQQVIDPQHEAWMQEQDEKRQPR